MRRHCLAAIVLSLNMSLLLAQDGLLDTGFGTGGKVTTAIGGSTDIGYSVAIQSDGKIVVAGYSVVGHSEFALVRYNSDGSLDTAGFGTGGKVTTAIGTIFDEGYSAAVQSNGKIVVAGWSYNGSNYDIALVRYNTNGSLDTTGFGTGGKVTTAIGSGDDQAYSVAIQPDGRIVVAGLSLVGANDDFAVVRYNSDGSLDGTFGSGGKVTTAIGPGHDYGQSVAIQTNGKIVVAGYSWNSSLTYWDIALVRYNANGSLDTTGFGTGGKVRTPIGGGYNAGYSVAIQSDGKIVVAGNSFGTYYNDFTLVRYDSTGSLDGTFNTTGIVTTDIVHGDDYARSVAIQSDGKIVVAGYYNTGPSTYNKFALVRYNSNGSLDGTFGSGGKDTTAIGSAYDNGYSVAIQSDGKIVVAGSSGNGSNDDFALVRYDNPSLLPVELTTFTAEVMGRNAEIGWRTATETNSYGFKIERKVVDQKTFAADWTLVGFVPGSGTSAASHEYTFVDRGLPSGRYDYRIKQIDKDGSFKYTQSVEVEVGFAPKAFTLRQNYPNPFNPSTTIEFTVPSDAKVTLKVYDMLGREVATLVDGEVKAGIIQHATFDASRFASGIYISRLEFGGDRITKRMALIK
jgi:uncharacterized delta-60 repeat protein